eukprot:5270489-Pyramimonas_sp.AAC.1
MAIVNPRRLSDVAINHPSKFPLHSRITCCWPSPDALPVARGCLGSRRPASFTYLVVKNDVVA